MTHSAVDRRNNALREQVRTFGVVGSGMTVRPDIRDRMTLALFVACTTVLLSPGLILGPDHDASVFLTVGAGVVDGRTPYLDLWDHKPPLIYLIHAMGTVLPGPPWLGVWMMTASALLATAAMLVPLVGVPAALLALVASGGFSAAQGGGLTETFATFFALGAVGLTLRGRPLLAGIAAGAAVLTSLLLVAIVPALLLLAPRRAWPRGVLGAAIPVTAVAAWLVFAGALPAAWDAVVTYNRLYLGLDRSADLGQQLPSVAFMLFPLAMLSVAGAMPRTRLGFAALAWLTVGFALLAMNGRLFPHHFTPLIVPLAILAAPGIERIGRARRWVVPGFVIGSVLVGAVIEPVVHAHLHAGPPSRAVAAWLTANTDPSASVLIWGFEPAAAVLADRASAGRYPYYLPLTTRNYATPALVDEWVASLRADPPAVIVDARGAFAVPRPGSGGGRDLDLIDPFRAFVAERYVDVAVVAGRSVYLPRE